MRRNGQRLTHISTRRNAVLYGRKYKLWLEGRECREEYRVINGSPHSFISIRGKGSIRRLVGRKRVIAEFSFSIPHGFEARNGLDALQFERKRKGNGRTKEYMQLLPERIPDLIDLICERALRTYKAQKNAHVPHLSFDPIKIDELVFRGFMCDKGNQMHLPFVA